MNNNGLVQLSREQIEKGLYEYRDINFSLEDLGVTDPSDLEMMTAWGEVVSNDLVAINANTSPEEPTRLILTEAGKKHLAQQTHLIR